MTVNLRVSLTEKQREENKDVEGEPLHNRNAEVSKFFHSSFAVRSPKVHCDTCLFCLHS